MNRNAALFVVMCLVWRLTWWPVKVGAAHARLLATALLVNTGNYALLFWGVVNFATIPVFSLLASRWLEGTPIARRQVVAIAVRRRP